MLKTSKLCHPCFHLDYPVKDVILIHLSNTLLFLIRKIRNCQSSNNILEKIIHNNLCFLCNFQAKFDAIINFGFNFNNFLVNLDLVECLLDVVVGDLHHILGHVLENVYILGLLQVHHRREVRPLILVQNVHIFSFC